MKKIELGSLTSFVASRRWNAQWIWPSDCEARPKNTFVLFRKTFHLANPAGAAIFISADTRYQLYVNGQFVARGQPQSQPYYQYYNRHDLSEFLAAGDNCIGVIVYHLGTNDISRGGLLAEIVDAGGQTILATDDSWRGLICDAWASKTFQFHMNHYAAFQEHFDAQHFPQDFSQVRFDDRAWLAAEAVRGWNGARPPAAGPWSLLIERDIAYPAEASLYAQAIHVAGESISLNSRVRGEDISVALSQPISPLKFARFDGPENLLSEGKPATACCSTNHLSDREFDGVYDPCVVLDFGKIVTGYLELDVEGPAGACIDIGYAERLIDGHFNNAIEGQFADRYLFRDGRQKFTPFHWRAFRFIKLQIRRADKPIQIHTARALHSTYPFDERGSFHGGDETLNRVFDISRYTLRLCSHEAIMDTPWRESAQWLGDVAAVTVPAIYACFGDVVLPGKFFRQSGMNLHSIGLLANISNDVPTNFSSVIPDYSLWWIIGMWGHYLYTGDRRWIDDFYPHVLRILQAHLCHVSDDGLIEDMPYWAFIDWADIDKRGKCAAYNALFYGSLASLLEMAQLKNDQTTLEIAARLRDTIKANFAAQFFDEKRGLLSDARIGAEFSGKTSEQANLAAIRFGLLDDELSKKIVARLYDGEFPANVTESQPFFMVVVLQALAQIGRIDLALELIRRRWGKRMLDHGASSTFEEWTINGSRRSGSFAGFMRTASHAWSACPAEFLIRNLIGLEITSPGCAAIRLNPAVTEFDYDVTFPTPKGAVRVVNRGGKIQKDVPTEIVIMK